MPLNPSSPSLPTHNPSVPPVKVPFNFRNVRSFPTRFFNPPDPHVPRRRSYHVKPHFTVTLDDVLSNKHLPPLSATDFEYFLIYVEHEQGSVQNLYFLLWLNQYTKQYNEWKGTLSAQQSPASSQASRSNARPSSQPKSLPTSSEQKVIVGGATRLSTGVRDAALPETDNSVSQTTDPSGRPRTSARTRPSKPLAYSWYRACRAFFLPLIADGGPLSTATNPRYQSHLRLKLHPELLRPFIADSPNPLYDRFPIDDVEDDGNVPTHHVRTKGGGLVHPAPERFALIKAEVERRLHESLDRFIDASFANTGNHRGIFGTTISLVSILAAFLLLLGVGFWKWSYYLFILTWFLLWLGSWGVLVTINGICFCVFLFGSRQWFHYEVEQCNLPRPSQSDDGQELGEVAKAPGATLVSSPYIPDEASEATRFYQLETQKAAREYREEAERRNCLAEASARFPSEGLCFCAPTLPQDSNGVQEKEIAVDLRPHACHSETDSSFVPQSMLNGEGGIFISEAYSEGFSAPSSLIQVSLAGSSVRDERDVADVNEQMGQLQRRELHCRTESLIEVNSARDTRPGTPVDVVQATYLQPPYPIPLGPRSAPSEYARTDDTPWPTKLQSVSVAEGQVVADIEYPSPPRQLIPHDHEQLKSSHVQRQRQHRNPPPHSDASRSHKHREHRAPSATRGASMKEHEGPNWPKFDFDKLPKEAPPHQLTGDRRAIGFTAPMTSIQDCPLVVRMHWLVVVRSILWGTVISVVLEAVCVGVILGVQTR